MNKKKQTLISFTSNQRPDPKGSSLLLTLPEEEKQGVPRIAVAYIDSSYLILTQVLLKCPTYFVEEGH